MFCWLVILVLLILFFAAEFFAFRKFKKDNLEKRRSLSTKYKELKIETKRLQAKIDELDSNLGEYFLFYDTTRKIAPLLDKNKLFSLFSEEIHHLGHISDIRFGDFSGEEGYLKFELEGEQEEHLSIKTHSRKVIEYIPYFVKLLSLCLDKMKLYHRLQELSILDSLTKLYNRRYFALRFNEEFERARRFGLDLSFLMLDIDWFKKINDTYGHLVGDAVLREVARIVKENIREIDVAGRYGGEEFAVFLLETDKAGAIMVAERISSRISREVIKVFDESLTTTLSIGVASYPQNTLYPDVLVEVADKALYKAKVSGKNRVCWF